MENQIFIHGAAVSRLMTEVKKEIEISISIAKTKGLVLARSAFHHSLNYESVVIFGKGKLIKEVKEKNQALKSISEHLIPGRWEEVRQPSLKELKATHVISISWKKQVLKLEQGDP